ncbi:hypothetical protein D1BOALGB6SA_8431 [Olavius sp. associated proteobacterium Delta 1]|nr:hypothetical protein D1BOALGB6SA_8431 [Olavius sp. associated proteobacterium Delta 1]
MVSSVRRFIVKWRISFKNQHSSIPLLHHSMIGERTKALKTSHMMVVYFCFKIGYKSAQQSKQERTGMLEYFFPSFHLDYQRGRPEIRLGL